MATFEEAKAQFLKKIGNKSWGQLHEELEAENSAKSDKLMTPEYIAGFGKPNRQADEKKGK